MYTVEFTEDAERDLSRLDAVEAQRILKKLRWLAENFDLIKPKPLTAHWKGLFKVRVGDYRVIYTYDRTKRKIVVHFVGHRREIYK